MRPEDPRRSRTGPIRNIVRDDDELRRALQSHLDTARIDLAADLESGLAEKVEKMEIERRRKRVAHAASGL